MLSKRFYGAALMAAVVLPTVLVGCGEDGPGIPGQDDLCCTEFKVGADLTGANFGVDASIQGQFEVLAQGAADFSATATTMLDDVISACRGIAQDLGADAAAQDAAEKKTNPRDKATEWCKLATASLEASGAVSGSLDIQPPSFSCEASVDAKANCQAKCSVDGKCDIKANPPRCTGGTLKVECGGKCTAEANAPSFSCKGKCDVAVSGSCTAQGGVDCTGECEGTCEGKAGIGDGAQADGTCKGTCKGSCSVTAPNANCQGSFEGECKGSCVASPGSAKVECSGKCEVEATPLKCEGGKLEGGCKVDAKCDANCDASLSAKASCDVRPFSIKAKGQGAANVKIDAAIATLQVNLPKLLIAVKARGEAMGRIAGQFTGKGTADLVADPGKLGVKGTACALAVVASVADAAQNAQRAIQTGASVTAKIGL